MSHLVTAKLWGGGVIWSMLEPQEGTPEYSNQKKKKKKKKFYLFIYFFIIFFTSLSKLPSYIITTKL